MEREGGKLVSTGSDRVNIADAENAMRFKSSSVVTSILRDALRQDCQQSCKELASVSVCDTKTYQATDTSSSIGPRVPTRNSVIQASAS